MKAGDVRPVTVAELIQLLSSQPGDSLVRIDGCDCSEFCCGIGVQGTWEGLNAKGRRTRWDVSEVRRLAHGHRPQQGETEWQRQPRSMRWIVQELLKPEWSTWAGIASFDSLEAAVERAKQVDPGLKGRILCQSVAYDKHGDGFMAYSIVWPEAGPFPERASR